MESDQVQDFTLSWAYINTLEDQELPQCDVMYLELVNFLESSFEFILSIFFSTKSFLISLHNRNDLSVAIKFEVNEVVFSYLQKVGRFK